MSQNLETFVKHVCRENGNDAGRMMDICRAVQAEFRCVSPEAMTLIAQECNCDRSQVEGVVSFYHFFSTKKQGEVVIWLCDDVIDEMKGSADVAEALKQELGVDFGQTTTDGKFTLGWTPCMGLPDQAPAAMINEELVTNLTGDKIREMVRELRAGASVKDLVKVPGDGMNADPRLNTMVSNNIRVKGPVIFADIENAVGLKAALAKTPEEVIEEVKTSGLRGRGGAGFSTGLKWMFTRGAEGEQKYIMCNADEGEPGTFKDRIILTECADMVFEGMTIAGYAIGSTEGVLYLRGEYAYMKEYLDSVLEERRDAGLLGKNVAGKEGFDYDIRVQLGAGAYVCGEESALISSCEGTRGDVKTRPPYPAQKGYKGKPTSVNNVETFASVNRIFVNSGQWFSATGSCGSSGTKLLSVSGDCKRPGIYEVPFGMKLIDFLKMCGGEDAIAVQVGGPSGELVNPDAFGRSIEYDDLATGGSMMVFGPGRDVLKVASKFLEFFVEESCGYCTPCRAGNVFIKERLDRIIDGKGDKDDIAYLEQLCNTVKVTSRCGLGQTSPNPVTSTLKNFRGEYESRIQENPDRMELSFDINAELTEAAAITGRMSEHF